MSELELITTALAAGAGIGAKDVVSSVLKDSYLGLKALLGKRLAGHGESAEALQRDETDPAVWQVMIGDDLIAAGATSDEDVLAAARSLLGLLKPDGDRVGTSVVTVDTNYGAAGTFNAPVSITNHASRPGGEP